MRIALNHIVSPRQSLPEFFAMATSLGVSEVEIRNDLPGVPLQDGTAPAEVRKAAEAAGITILSINALYPFNVWSEATAKKAENLAEYAAAIGAQAVVMCPLNENTPVARGQLIASLVKIKPILAAYGLTGLVEPLGFPISSMRTKADAISAIKEADGEGVYKLVHDTFHHYLAGETEFFPEWTGLVHISGVSDPSVAVSDMLDAHRVLIDSEDRLGNIAQIKTLLLSGYTGPFSFEPFAEEIGALEDPETALRKSIDFITAVVK